MKKICLGLIIFLLLNSISALADEPPTVGDVPQCVSTGRFNSCLIDKDGSLFIWGSSTNLGIDSNDNSLRKSLLDGKWKAVECGTDHTLAIKDDGSLWSWGVLNACGYLGDGTTKDRLYPKQISKDKNWKEISATETDSFAIKTDGSLWAWGLNCSGQLGDGTMKNRLIPTRIGKHNDWAHISAGAYFTMGIKKNGTLWSWGANNGGQLGNGTTKYCRMPKQVGKDKNWVMVSSGPAHTLALKSDGSLWAWGSCTSGQVGNGIISFKAVANSPKRIGRENDWVYVSAGDDCSMAIKKDGSLWEWGKSSFWILEEEYEKSVPTRFGSDNDWIKVCAGYRGGGYGGGHNLGVKANGTVWTWGNNANGQCNPFSEKHGFHEPVLLEKIEKK